VDLIKRNLYVSFLGLTFFLSLVTDWYYILSVALLCMTVVTILDKLGKGIVLRELIVLHAVFVCLVMPIFGYEVYNRDNFLSRVFIKFMLVPRERYFDFVLPAISAFSLALCWPIKWNTYMVDEGLYFKHLIKMIRGKLAPIPQVGTILIVIGILIHYITAYLPVGLQFVATLFFSSCFSGVLYIYYSPSFRYKRLLLFSFGVFIAWMAVQSGVFTIVAYMGITLFSFFFLGRRSPFWKKVMACLAGTFLLFLVQNIKVGYRQVAWKSNYAGNKTALFTEIASDKLSNFKAMFDVNSLFRIYTRTNEGYNITLVMRWIPAAKQFDNGSRLALVAAASVVPRFLWPDKPQAGGKESMMYFTGFRIGGWSTNVSPVGEAYGSFGTWGGIVFLFLLGMFIRAVYKRVFTIARTMPLILLWIPVLFFQVTYSMETDTLQILNSLFKGAFFLWLLYKVFPQWFGMKEPDHTQINSRHDRYPGIPKEGSGLF
jgi:hypothetical protein